MGQVLVDKFFMKNLFEQRASEFQALFGVPVPLMNAPMAAITTPAMVAEVAAAGGLGILAGDLLSADELQRDIRSVKALTDKPFAVNLRVPPKNPSDRGARAVHEALTDLMAQLNLPTEYAPRAMPDFDAQIEVLLAEEIPVVCTSFGGLREVYAEKLEARGVTMMGAATCLKEAKVLRSAGCQAIVVQGAEAGGPRLSFEIPDEQALIGLSSLIGPAARATRRLIVASGGIATGAQMAASMLAGASAAMVGTLLLRTPESAAHPMHKDILQYMSDNTLELTRVFSGRLTRVVSNGFVEAMKEAKLMPAQYPAHLRVMLPILQAAREQDRDDLLEFGAGQSACYAPFGSTRAILEKLASECRGMFD